MDATTCELSGHDVLFIKTHASAIFVSMRARATGSTPVCAMCPNPIYIGEELYIVVTLEAFPSCYCHTDCCSSLSLREVAVILKMTYEEALQARE